jgi:fibronectin type 3 domain-containing protein
MRYLISFVLAISLPLFGQVKAKVTPATSSTGPSVALSCTPSPTGAAATGFNFYRSTTSGGPYTILGTSPMSSTCAYTDTTVGFSQTYFYVATAVDSSGESGYSSQVSAAVPANPIPNAPINLTVGTITAENVPLQWEPPLPQTGITVESYNVYDCAESTCPAPPKVATVTATSFTAPCTRKNKLCYFDIRANDLVAGKKVLTAPSNIVEAKVD